MNLALIEAKKELLASNLATIRKICDLTQEVIASKLGVTRQSITNLEQGAVKMSTPMYIAIRVILTVEIKDDETRAIINHVLDAPQNDNADKIAKSILGMIAGSTGAAVGLFSVPGVGALFSAGLLNAARAKKFQKEPFAWTNDFAGKPMDI